MTVAEAKIGMKSLAVYFPFVISKPTFAQVSHLASKKIMPLVFFSLPSFLNSIYFAFSWYALFWTKALKIYFAFWAADPKGTMSCRLPGISVRPSVRPSVCPSDRTYVRPSVRPSIRSYVRPPPLASQPLQGSGQTDRWFTQILGLSSHSFASITQLQPTLTWWQIASIGQTLTQMQMFPTHSTHLHCSSEPVECESAEQCIDPHGIAIPRNKCVRSISSRERIPTT